MCDCNSEVNEVLAEHDTELALPLMMNGAATRCIVQTRRKGDFSGRRKVPMTMFATYCPFCGEKYPQADSEEETP